MLPRLSMARSGSIVSHRSIARRVGSRCHEKCVAAHRFDPEIYLLAAERLGVSPPNCLVFEDSMAGVQAARAAGMRTVGVRTTHPNLTGVDLTVDHFLSAELEPWLHKQHPLP